MGFLQRSRRSTRSTRSGGGYRFRGVDRTTLALIAAGVTLVLALVFPRVYPAARRGPECSDLASPLGGNNRSMLAMSGGDSQNLEIELDLESTRISLNGRLSVNLRFINNDSGPVILYLDQRQPPINTDSNTIGIRFEIRYLNNTAAVDEGARAAPDGWPNIVINPEQLHLLGSRARCNESFQFDLGQLQPGEYRIRAFYYNNHSGIWQSNIYTIDRPTPTQAYLDQGVWTGRVSSQEVLFSIQPPGG